MQNGQANLSFDHTDWSTDTFDVVDKEEYEVFVEENNLRITLD